MKALKKFMDNIKPHFEEGGKLGKFKSVYEGFDTFLFVPDKVTNIGSHIRDAVDLKRTMSIVVLALVPALLFGMYNVGYQYFLSIGQEAGFWDMFLHGLVRVLPLVIVSYVVGLGIEFAFAQIRKHEINEGFLVSGMLIPLIIPVDTPLWMVAVATAFAVIIGKEVFGGTGMNIWNPALITRAFLFFAYPSKMSGDFVWVSGLSSGEGVVDTFSGATPLAKAISQGTDAYSVWDSFVGLIPGSIGETSTIAIILGAIILLYTGIASWKIMLSTVVGGLVMGWIFQLFAVNPFMSIPAWHHLILGGFAFGAVFMATDPVSGAQTERGKWIYGFLIGFFAVMIRVFNPAYPEGMMLAILLMNTFAPLIDHYVVQGSISRRLKRAKVKA
ncbi:MAG: NADH:ubiquinone reductase (Na(+)-transporting) subunit B [Bacteroidales bacterium]|jgi:Na+-transporting NADH:ubiquinone oxidoreductase subunit B|nr:NADH:ubiquinone reductase (Na(+)-transporting) subunit B [Bacteroidales bacterium]